MYTTPTQHYDTFGYTSQNILLEDTPHNSQELKDIPLTLRGHTSHSLNLTSTKHTHPLLKVFKNLISYKFNFKTS